MDKVKPTKSIKKTFKNIVKTTSKYIPITSKYTKRLEAEKALLTGRLVEIENMLKVFEENPEVLKAVELILNPLEIE
jgi:hypothetical protein